MVSSIYIMCIDETSLYAAEQPTKAAWWPFDPESGVRVTCDVAYLCANFGNPIGSILDLDSMYATDVKQTSDKSIA